MGTITHILFVTLLLTLSGCNEKQKSNTFEQTSADTLIIENSAVENNYEQNIQDLAVFSVYWLERSDIAFVSLSDIYLLEDDDSYSLALPNIEEMGVDSAQYFVLEKRYRDRFLSETKISETDSVFIYDYSINKLVPIVVKNLKVVAMVTVYASERDYPYPPYYYMIGFEIDAEKLKGFSDYYRHTLVSAGKENPFVQEPLTPIVWGKIATEDYPSKEIEGEYNAYLKTLAIGDTHLFEANGLQYFLQTLLDKQFSQPTYRRLLVVDSKTKDIIIEKIYGRGEGTSVSPLNYEYVDAEINQWTSRLFKNKPPVVFGFEYISFGCPFISIIDKSNEDIFIYCDNRH
jgi:hypothetical protein